MKTMDRTKKRARTKVDKPLAERRRRARINDALLQLKAIVLQSIGNEQSSFMSKLEKADILEMTVEYIHKMQLTQSSGNSQNTSGTSTPVLDGSQYTTGFNECASHVADCISNIPDNDIADDNIRTRLLEHLVNVASSEDFRDKSKHTLDTGGGDINRNGNVGNERKISEVETDDNSTDTVFQTNAERDESAKYTTLECGVSDSGRNVNAPYVMLQSGVTSTGKLDVNDTFIVLQNEVPNGERDVNFAYTVCQGGVYDVGRNENFKNVMLQSAERDVNAAYTMLEMLESGVSDNERHENDTFTVMQSGVCKGEKDVNTAYAMQSEFVYDKRDVNAAYTMLQNEVSNVERNENAEYAILKNKVGIVDIDVNNTNTILQNGIANAEGCVYTTYNIPQSDVSNAERGVYAGQFMLQRGVLSDRGNENSTYPMLQNEVSNVEKGVNIKYTMLQDTGEMDLAGRSAETGRDENKADDTLVAAKDSKIINIPKKRRVLGDFTNTSYTKWTENTKGLAKTTRISGNKPQVRSPGKGTPVKKLRQVPKPIKKRLSSSVYKENSNILMENGNQVFTFNNNRDVSQKNITESIEDNQAPCVPNGYDCNMVHTSQMAGTYLNNQVCVDGLYISEDCQSYSAENSRVTVNENISALPKSTNEIPQNYTLQGSKNYTLSNMDEVYDNRFYQHYLANSRHENMWRPW